MSENGKMNFGITTETKTTNNTPILVATKVENNPLFPNGWKFPKARLVSVITNPKFETKNGDTSVLQFIFIDKDKRQHIHTEWKIDTDDTESERIYLKNLLRDYVEHTESDKAIEILEHFRSEIRNFWMVNIKVDTVY